MLISPEINPTISEQVYHILKKAIVTGHLQWGQQLKETQLALELNVSRSPIRDALRMLSGDGLVVNTPNKGVFVRKVTEKEINDVIDFRLLLEGQGIQKAKNSFPPEKHQRFIELRQQLDECYANQDTTGYAHADYSLHKEIINLCDNTFMNEIGERMYILTQILRVSAFLRKDRFDHSYQEHRQLLNSLLENRFEEALATCQDHLETTRNELKIIIREHLKHC